MTEVRGLHLPRFALRSADLGRRLDLFLVCAVGSVLGNRAFLIATGYPQLGNGTLHISHAIWGASMMAVAIVFALSFLAPNNRTFIAFIGGCGFGWFIDELGKFITRDVDYFFRPTIALIYVIFIAMYLGFRGIERGALSADEALTHGVVSRIVGEDELDATAREIAEHIASLPAVTVKMAREVIRHLAVPAIRSSMSDEMIYQTFVNKSDDIAELRAARAEDREPRYTGS